MGFVMNKKDIEAIAYQYEKSVKTEKYSLQLLNIVKSKFLDGYWDVSYKVIGESGNEMDGPLLVVINDDNGKISTMEEIIMQQCENPNVKISNLPLKPKSHL